MLNSQLIWPYWPLWLSPLTSSTQNPLNLLSHSHIRKQTCLIHEQSVFHLWVMPLVGIGETHYQCCPNGDIVLSAMLPVLQQSPEMTADKQWEQTVPPTSIDLAPSTLPALTNNATLIPPTLSLYESPLFHLPFPLGLTKMINDQPLLPLPPPPGASCWLSNALQDYSPHRNQMHCSLKH